VNEHDPGETARLLFYLEHAVVDRRLTRRGEPQVVSKRLCFIEARPDGSFRDAGAAPYLDYRPASPQELAALASDLDAPWLQSEDWERQTLGIEVKGRAAGQDQVTLTRTEVLCEFYNLHWPHFYNLSWPHHVGRTVLSAESTALGSIVFTPPGRLTPPVDVWPPEAGRTGYRSR